MPRPQAPMPQAPGTKAPGAIGSVNMPIANAICNANAIYRANMPNETINEGKMTANAPSPKSVPKRAKPPNAHSQI